MGGLPVTKNAFENLTESDEAIHTFTETLDKGRLFATTKFGGMLEIQLVLGLTDLWANLSKYPSDDLKETIKKKH